MMRHVVLRTVASAALLLSAAGVYAVNPTATVTITTASPQTSALNLGYTHTSAGVDKYGVDPTAAARAKMLLGFTKTVQATQTIAWGVLNIEPTQGTYDWSTLDTRMALMDSIDPDPTKPIIMTFCTSPGYTKSDGNTWNLDEAPTDAYFAAYADECLEIAKRYPQCKAFQIWNEFKGFWNSTTGNWDYTRYTNFYNTIYDKLNTARTNGTIASDVKIGGFYLVMSGTGGGKTGVDAGNPIVSKDLTVINYWIQHRHGGDFLCVDRGTVDYQDTNSYTIDEKLALTHWFEDLITAVNARQDAYAPSIPKIPVVYSEYYCPLGNDQQHGAGMASTYHHMVNSGCGCALLWNPIQGETSVYLLSDLTSSTGGRPTESYRAYRSTADFFSSGKTYYPTSSTVSTIESMAASDKMMLINKSSSAYDITVGSSVYTVGAYDFQSFHRNALVRQTLSMVDSCDDGSIVTGQHWYLNSGNSSTYWKFPATGDPFGTGNYMQYGPGSVQIDNSIVTRLPSALTISATTGVRLHFHYQDASSTGGELQTMAVGLFNGTAVTADGYPKFGDSDAVSQPTQDWSGYLGNLSFASGTYNTITKDEATNPNTDSPFYSNTELGEDVSRTDRGPTGGVSTRTLELLIYKDAAGNVVTELWDGEFGKPLSLVTHGVDRSASKITSFANVGICLHNNSGAASNIKFDTFYVDTYNVP